MNKKDELEATINTARRKLNKIIDTEKEAEAKKLVGKCFKVKNSYGGDTKDWWVYLLITSTSGSGFVTTISFQNDKTGRLEVQTRFSNGFYESHIKIPRSEYNRAKKSFLGRVEQALDV